MDSALLRRLSKITLGAVALTGAMVFARHTWTFGDDVGVYLDASKHFLAGERLYAPERDGMLCFKYPPYFGTLFAPLTLLGWSNSKLLWIALQSLGFCAWIALLGRSVHPTRLLGVVIACWGLFMGNAFFGQISMLAGLSLTWLFSSETWTPLRRTVLLLALSAKVFGVVSLVWLREALRPARAWFAPLLLLAALSIPALWIGEPSPLQGLRDLHTAMGSSAHFATEFRNQGLPAFIQRLWLRAAHTEPSFAFSLGVFAVCALIATLAWERRWKPRLPRELKLHAAVALGVAIHPMAWKHAYLLALGLLALGVESLNRYGTRAQAVAGWISVAGVGFFTSSALGPWVGAWGDFISIKAFGVVLMIETLSRLDFETRRFPIGHAAGRNTNQVA